MPVPWQRELLLHRVESPPGTVACRPPEKNGIRLYQLRNLKDYAACLCKVGVLTHTSDHSKAQGLFGTPIRWTMLNMYNINQEIILKVIPKHNPCSFVEILSSDSQDPKVFVSHSWNEPFRDFMTGLEYYKKSMGISFFDAFWICTFANNQFKVDLGQTLEVSPFYLALQSSQTVLLMLDKVGTALSRIWCVFEMKTTLLQEKKLDIATPLGLVDTEIESSQVMEVLRSVDVRSASATNPVDKRQILNNIAGVEQESGLKVHAGGKKDLDPDTLAPEGSLQQYKYDEDLLQQHTAKFDEVNKFIQDKAEKLSVRGTGCVVPSAAERGLTLAQLRRLSRRAQTYFFRDAMKEWRQEKKIKDWGDINIFHLIDPFMKEVVEKENKSSFMECIADKPQRPEFLITTAFSTHLQDLMASLEWHAEARDLPESATYFFLPAAMLQKEADTWISTKCLPPSFCAMEWFQGQVVIVEEEAALLTRALPMLEVSGILNNRKSMDLACPTGVLATNAPFKQGWEFGFFNPEIAHSIVSFDVAKVTGKVVDGCDHAQLTLCRIAGLTYKNGDKAPEKCKEYEQFNSRFRSKAYGPMLRACVARSAAGEGDLEELQACLDNEICSLSAMSLRGLCGETPLHLAASGGHVDILELLLDEGAHVDTQDIDGETPLHYAAIAGQVEAVKLLLDRNASSTVESYFMERPIDLAKENPAKHLGIQTERLAEIVDLLSDDQYRSVNRRCSLAESPKKSRQSTKNLAVMPKNLAAVPENRPAVHNVLECFEKGDCGEDGLISAEDLASLFQILGLNVEYKNQDFQNILRASKAGDDKVDYSKFLSWLLACEDKGCCFPAP